jgi:hypothetical protein
MISRLNNFDITKKGYFLKKETKGKIFSIFTKLEDEKCSENAKIVLFLSKYLNYQPKYCNSRHCI